MKNHVRPWVRMFAAEADTGQGPGAPQGSADLASTQHDTTAAQSDHESETDTRPDGGTDSDDGEDDNLNRRGGLRAVLADLAKERDKRQEAEAARDEYKARIDEIDQANMTELERTQAQLAEANEQIATLKQAQEQQARQQMVAKVLADVKLPAEMADRLRGETEEELAADAKTLAEALGFDRKPVDPTQTQGGRRTGAPMTLQQATDARLNIKR
ncbi:capsid assembly scaffolding protein Gp46 family protein [Corynebacterium renale]|uniref:Uncharacterized protein n=1 Tax=Corynebacterium renale TaxID=1724 RepID=A0A2A9DMM2_9CORY|nr:DUF4355 domain-containing protein [Corynebacterium renale]PFG27405.1 hypothetical protein ATK06_0461 [Corynebacterium renale]SQI23475.1 Uncharacterised protein [Corynebacterium renale]